MQIDFSPSFRDKLFYYTLDNTKIPVSPLMIAVSGHRNIDPQSLAPIREKVEQWFLKIGYFWQKKQGFRPGETSCAPILVFDGMATGADTLIAEVLLKIKKERPDLNFQLIATLPMPKNLYINDFTQESELETFNNLCNEADYIIELPLVPENLPQTDEHSEYGLTEEQRMAQYEQLGKALASNSMFLLALWDGDLGVNGVPNAGGTADVVRMKLNGVVSDDVTPIQLETLAKDSGVGVIEPNGVVFQIFAPRVSQPSSKQQAPGNLYYYLPEEDNYQHPAERKIPKGKKIKVNSMFSLKKISEPFNESASLNKDALRNVETWKQSKTESKEWLLGKNPPQDADLQFMTEQYTVLDALAMAYQKSFFLYAFIYILFILAFSLVFYLETYYQPLDRSILSDQKFFRHIYMLDCFYFLFLSILFLLFGYVRWRAFYEKYHRYRALAEILRVQIFWYIAAIPDKSLYHYWSHQIHVMSWLRTAAKSLLFTVGASAKPDFNFVKERWLNDQYKYFTYKFPFYSKADNRIENISWMFLCITVVWFFVRVFVKRDSVVDMFINNKSIYMYKAYLCSVVFMAMTGVIAFACILWNRLKANNSLVKRYKKIAPIYSQVLYAFKKINDSNAPQSEKDLDRKKLLRYLGEYALMENADWFLMARKLELPK